MTMTNFVKGREKAKGLARTVQGENLVEVPPVFRFTSGSEAFGKTFRNRQGSENDPIGGNMILKIKLDEGAIMPTRAHRADAGLDLYTQYDVTVPSLWDVIISVVRHAFGISLPKGIGGDYFALPSVSIDTGVHVQIPFGFFGDIRSKSGLLFSKNVITDGTIDCGYTGSIKVKLINLGVSSVKFKAGDKIAQMVISRCELPEIFEVDEFEKTERGDNGFGSTGR